MRNMEIHSYVCVCLHLLFTTLVFLLKPSLQFSILLDPLFYVLMHFIIALFSKLHLGNAGFWDVLKKITFSFPSLVEGQSLPFTCLTNYKGQSACTGQETCSNHLSDLGPVWYMCLKTENCCLKFFVEIRVGEKVY